MIDAAWAQDATSTAAASPVNAGLLESFFPFLLIIGVMYLFIFRPQQKKMKEHQDMLGALKRGDKVLTGGGIIGTVKKVEDSVIHVELAEGLTVEVARHTISGVMNGNAAPAASNDDAPAKGNRKKNSTNT